MKEYTLYEMILLSYGESAKQWNRLSSVDKIIPNILQDLSVHQQLRLTEVFWIACIGILFTILRVIATFLIFQPLSKTFGLLRKDQKKFAESCSKLILFSIFFTWEYYLVNILYPELRYDLSSQWKDLSETVDVPSSIKLLYLLQAGFYLHSIYATVCMDTWRFDSVAMIFHHILAIVLLVFSYAVRYHLIGLLVLYLHDLADVVLESTKIVVYLKTKSHNVLLEALSTLGFIIFLFVWLYLRLLVYPGLVLFSSSYFATQIHPHGRFYFVFNGMLFMLYALNLWWFRFIVMLAYRLLSGKEKGVADIRESDEKQN